MSELTQSLPACLLSQKVLALTPSLLLWHLPAASHCLHVASVTGDTVTIPAPWPSLLLCVTVGRSGKLELHLAAIRRQGRPAGHTPLYHAPFMNIDDNGLFLGELNSAPAHLDPRSLEQWEDTLYGFRFSVVGHEKTLRPADMSPGATINGYHHARAWREISRSGVDRFPGQMLVPRKQTLQQWLIERDNASLKVETTKRAARPGPAALALVQDSSVMRRNGIALG